MNIDKSSWHYKVWLKSFERPYNAPERTDLCHYCHRIFWGLLVNYLVPTALAVCGIGGAVVIVLSIIRVFYLHTVASIAVTIGIVAAVAVIVIYVRWFIHEPRSFVGKVVDAKKRGVCPLIEFSEESNERDD